MKAARQQQIVELLNQHHTLTTEALSHLLQVSIETIRRDLSELQKQGVFSVATGRRAFSSVTITTARSLFIAA
jgi:DeoR family L-fucose operon activator